MPEKISLYQCFHAKVSEESIVCGKDHSFSRLSSSINIERLARGEPLELTVCQECPDYLKMGPPLLPEDRGWKETLRRDYGRVKKGVTVL